MEIKVTKYRLNYLRGDGRAIDDYPPKVPYVQKCPTGEIAEIDHQRGQTINPVKFRRIIEDVKGGPQDDDEIGKDDMQDGKGVGSLDESAQGMESGVDPD
jgi:hypothetical protein